LKTKNVTSGDNESSAAVRTRTPPRGKRRASMFKWGAGRIKEKDLGSKRKERRHFDCLTGERECARNHERGGPMEETSRERKKRDAKPTMR